MSPERSQIFLSSVHDDFQEIRQSIAAWARANGHDLWLFEEKGTDIQWAATPVAEVERICLEAVDKADLFLGLFHRSYGSTAQKHSAGISFVELELFEAFKEGKPSGCLFFREQAA